MKDMEQNSENFAKYSPEAIEVMKVQYRKYLDGLKDKLKKGEELTEAERAAVVNDYLGGLKERTDKMKKENPVFDQLKKTFSQGRTAQDFLNNELPGGIMLETKVNRAVIMAMRKYAEYHIGKAADGATIKDELDYNFRNGKKFVSTVVDRESILNQIYNLK